MVTTEETVKERIEEAHGLIKKAVLLMQFPILATPSGNLRNILTDININLMIAEEHCTRARSKIKEPA